jgi:hypothetical protein
LSIITVLIFVGIPVAVFLLVAGMVYAGSARRGKRYRPGRPYRFTPVWFLSAPEGLAPDGGTGQHALERGPQRGELAAAAVTDERSDAERSAAEHSAAEHSVHAQDVTGGASDRW